MPGSSETPVTSTLVTDIQFQTCHVRICLVKGTFHPGVWEKKKIKATVVVSYKFHCKMGFRKDTKMHTLCFICNTDIQ